MRRHIQWIIPYYRNQPMLQLHLDFFRDYTDAIWDNLTIMYIDDGSPLPDRAEHVLKRAPEKMRRRIRLFRVEKDIPWNQHGARNLGAKLADSGWLLMTDMDRMMLSFDMEQLQTMPLSGYNLYKPRGIDVGERRPQSGKPVTNQFIVTRSLFWEAGGYDEDYCGTYGGDKPLLDSLARRAEEVVHLAEVRLLRYREAVQPGSTTTFFDRQKDQAEYGKRFRAKQAKGETTPVNPVRFPWTEVKLI